MALIHLITLLNTCPLGRDGTIKDFFGGGQGSPYLSLRFRLVNQFSSLFIKHVCYGCSLRWLSKPIRETLSTNNLGLSFVDILCIKFLYVTP